MNYVKVRTQAELDRVAPGDIPILVGNGRFEFSADRSVRVEGEDSPTIVSRESSTIRAVSWGSSTIRAESWESSTITAESRESSTIRAESWGSSTITAVSRESSTIRAVSRGSSTITAVSRESSTIRAESWESSTITAESWESSTITAVSRGSSTITAVSRESSTITAVSWGSSTIRGKVGKFSLVGTIQHGASKINLPGAVLLRSLESIETVEDWCDYYGCDIKRGRAVVYKLVDDNFSSGYGMLYEIGKESKCDDWEPTAVCGNGLHFSPSASATERYGSGTRYLACSVRVKDIVLIGDKIKAPSCRVLHEVDRFGDRVEVA